jgi:hypothetical protein
MNDRQGYNGLNELIVQLFLKYFFKGFLQTNRYHLQVKVELNFRFYSMVVKSKS